VNRPRPVRRRRAQPVRFDPDTVFPPGDWREQYFSGDRRAEAERRGKALAQVLDDEVRAAGAGPAILPVVPSGIDVYSRMRPPPMCDRTSRKRRKAADGGACSPGSRPTLGRNWYSD